MAAGLRVDRVVAPGGLAGCVVRESPSDVVDFVNILMSAGEVLPGDFEVAVHVRGVPLTPGACVLEVDVAHHGEGDMALARSFAGAVERFAVTSAEVGVDVSVGRWFDRRPSRVVRIGRRRPGGTPG